MFFLWEWFLFLFGWHRVLLLSLYRICLWLHILWISSSTFPIHYSNKAYLTKIIPDRWFSKNPQGPFLHYRIQQALSFLLFKQPVSQSNRQQNNSSTVSHVLTEVLNALKTQTYWVIKMRTANEQRSAFKVHSWIITSKQSFSPFALLSSARLHLHSKCIIIITSLIWLNYLPNEGGREFNLIIFPITNLSMER